jgi:hypothetical protein
MQNRPEYLYKSTISLYEMYWRLGSTCYAIDSQGVATLIEIAKVYHIVNRMGLGSFISLLIAIKIHVPQILDGNHLALDRYTES